MVVEYKQDCRGLRTDIEGEEMDKIDILPKTIVLLCPSERDNILGSLHMSSYL